MINCNVNTRDISTLFLMCLLSTATRQHDLVGEDVSLFHFLRNCQPEYTRFRNINEQ